MGLRGVGFGVGFGGLGWDRLNLRVDRLGFWAWWIALGHGGLGLGIAGGIWGLCGQIFGVGGLIGGWT